MAEVIWTEPALRTLDLISDYIAVESPDSAKKFARKIWQRVTQLQRFPLSGSRIPEWPNHSNRQLIIAPYRVIYRISKGKVYILHIAAPGQRFHPGLLA